MPKIVNLPPKCTKTGSFCSPFLRFKFQFIGQYRLVILSERSESKDPYSP